MQKPIEKVLSALQARGSQVKERPGNSTCRKRYTATCPAHDDKKASLSITEYTDGTVGLRCFAGCSTEAICNSLGLAVSDLMRTGLDIKPRTPSRTQPREPAALPTNAPEPSKQKNASTLGKIVDTYDYRDESGTLLYQVVRFDPKDFRQRRPNGDGWKWGLGDTRRVLYNLPAIVNCNGEFIFVTEGERDANNLGKMGLIATTCPMGAGKWQSDFNDYFQGKNVVVIPDQDEPGLRHGKDVAQSLFSHTKSITVLNLPQGKDVSDWIELGGTKDELLKLAGSTPIYKPETTSKAKTDKKTGHEQKKPSEDAPGSIERYKADPNILFDADPRTLAEYVLKKAFLKDGVVRLRRWRGDWYTWAGYHYRLMGNEELRKICYDTIESARIFKKDDSLERVKMTSTMLNNALDVIPSVGNLLIRDDFEPPLNLDGSDFPKNGIVCKNGIFDMQAGTVAPITPNTFAVNALDFEIDPATRHYNQIWIEFLQSIWPDDPYSILALQKWAGYLLTNDVSQQKIMMLIGPKRSGKSTIAGVLSKLLGKDNVSNTQLSSFGSHFALQSLIDKKLLILPDARLSSRTDQSVIVERLLSISGEDRLMVDRKYQPPLPSVKLRLKIMLLTNELPGLTDASGALASRFFPLKLTQSFLGSEDFNLFDKLAADMSGVFWWAVDGWKLFREEGRLMPPESALEVTESFARLTSPVQSFVDDSCILGPYFSVDKDALYERYREWCNQEGFNHGKTKNVFYRDLMAAFPQISVTRKKIEGERAQYVSGIGFNNG